MESPSISHAGSEEPLHSQNSFPLSPAEIPSRDVESEPEDLRRKKRKKWFDDGVAGHTTPHILPFGSSVKSVSLPCTPISNRGRRAGSSPARQGPPSEEDMSSLFDKIKDAIWGEFEKEHGGEADMRWERFKADSEWYRAEARRERLTRKELNKQSKIKHDEGLEGSLDADSEGKPGENCEQEAQEGSEGAPQEVSHEESKEEIKGDHECQADEELTEGFQEEFQGECKEQIEEEPREKAENESEPESEPELNHEKQSMGGFKDGSKEKTQEYPEGKSGEDSEAQTGSNSGRRSKPKTKMKVRTWTWNISPRRSPKAGSEPSPPQHSLDKQATETIVRPDPLRRWGTVAWSASARARRRRILKRSLTKRPRRSKRPPPKLRQQHGIEKHWQRGVGEDEVFYGSGTADPDLSCHQPSSGVDRQPVSDEDGESQTSLTNVQSESRDELSLNSDAHTSAGLDSENGAGETIAINDINADTEENASVPEPPTPGEPQLTQKESRPAADEPPAEYLAPPQTPEDEEPGLEQSETLSDILQSLAALSEEQPWPPTPPQPVTFYPSPLTPEEVLLKVDPEELQQEPQGKLPRPLENFFSRSLGRLLGWLPLNHGQNLSQHEDPKPSSWWRNFGRKFFRGESRTAKTPNKEPVADELHVEELEEEASREQDFEDKEGPEEGSSIVSQQHVEQPPARRETPSAEKKPGSKLAATDMEPNDPTSLANGLLMDQVNAWLDLLNLLHTIMRRSYLMGEMGVQRLRHVKDPEFRLETPRLPPLAFMSKISAYILLMHIVIIIHSFSVIGLQRERAIWALANRTTRNYLLERTHKYGPAGQPLWVDWDLVWTPRELGDAGVKGIALLQDGVETLVMNCARLYRWMRILSKVF